MSSSTTISINEDGHTEQVIMFDERQQIVLAIVPIVTGLISAIGSAAIIYAILLGNDTCTGPRRHQRGIRCRKSTFHRIMLCVSISDISNSIYNCTGTFLMPSDTPGVWNAHGTTETCEFQGFFAQLGLATALYSGSLAVYFVLSIHPDISEDTIQKKYESSMLFIPVLFALPTAIAGLILDLYNPVPLGIGCWVGSYPYGCSEPHSEIECTRGKHADSFLWLFGGSPVIISFLLVLCSMVSIYILFRSQMRRIQRRYSVGTSEASLQCLREITTQATLYIAAFLLTYVWTGLSKVIGDGRSAHIYFINSLLSQIFYPLQGFMNFVIFVRPRYLNLRKAHPNESAFAVLKMVFHGSKEREKRSTQFQISRMFRKSSKVTDNQDEVPVQVEGAQGTVLHHDPTSSEQRTDLNLGEDCVAAPGPFDQEEIETNCGSSSSLK